MKHLLCSFALASASLVAGAQPAAPASAPAAAPAAPAQRAYWVEVVLDHELQAWLDTHLRPGAPWRLHSVLPVPDGCLNEPRKSRVPCSRVIAQRAN